MYRVGNNKKVKVLYFMLYIYIYDVIGTVIFPIRGNIQQYVTDQLTSGCNSYVL
jgi:hypothetical protein